MAKRGTERSSPGATGAVRNARPAPGVVPRKALQRPMLLEARPGDDEHRGFPRIEKAVQFALSIGEGGDRSFSAALRSQNLSVSGAFLRSSFFLPIGTELQVRFEIDRDEDAVEARAEIVREDRSDESADHAGFGIRFLEFYSQTEVTLAKLFLGNKLKAFAQNYLQSKRARALDNELDRVVDALAAWELLNITTASDPWKP